jgi:hypothetical protein
VVYCNDQPCDPGEVCCFSPFGGQSACGAAGSCPDGAVEVSCNDPTDCPGATCCGDYNGTYTAVYCQPTCEGAGKILQCEGQPDVCPPGETCNPSGILGDGYSFCQ